MRVNVDLIAEAMFCGRQYFLDLDTGRTVRKIDIDAGRRPFPEHALQIPMYSCAQGYQQYLREMLPKTGIEDMTWVEEYPDLPLLREEHQMPILADEFVQKAVRFLEDTEWKCLEESQKNRCTSCLDGYDPTFKTHTEYFKTYIIQIAADWCIKKGFEYFREMDVNPFGQMA